MRKMDEMEAKIALESIRWAWSFTVFALFAWAIYDYIKISAFTMPFYLLVIQNVVYYLATQISKWKMGDEQGKNVIVWYFTSVVVCILGFGAILFFVSK